MRLALTCAALAAALNVAPAHAGGAKYKLAAQTRAVKYGAYYPSALTDYGLAAGTLYYYGGGSDAYFSAGKAFSDDAFCQALGQSGTSLRGISRDSALTYTAGECTSSGDGFLYNQSTNVVTALKYPGATLTVAMGVSDTGRVGGFYTDANSNVHGFYFDGGAYTAFDPPGSGATYVYSISPNNTITGTYTDVTGISHGFMLNQAGTYTTIDYPGAKNTVVGGVNSQNLAVGTIQFAAGGEQAFAWQAGSFILPPLPSNAYSLAQAVSESGIVAGYYGTSVQNVNVGYAWKPATNQVILVKAPAGATDLDVSAVNSRQGQLAGSYVDSASKTVGFIATCTGKACFSP